MLGGKDRLEEGKGGWPPAPGEQLIDRDLQEVRRIVLEGLRGHEARVAVRLPGRRLLGGTGLPIMKPLAGGALRRAGPALRFVLEHPVSTVIPGMDDVQQIDENARSGSERRPLSPSEREVLEEEAAQLGAQFCRRCEYCQPCPQGIDIPMVFLLDGYYTRYDLKAWARERYRALKSKIGDCIDCGECESKCPYSLPIRQMLRDAGARLGPSEPKKES